MTLLAIPKGLSALIGAFKAFGGSRTSVIVSESGFTRTHLTAVVARSIGKSGSKHYGSSRIDRQIGEIKVQYAVRFVDEFDTVLQCILANVHAVVQKAAEEICNYSFALAPRDTGRLEATANVVDTSRKAEFLVQFLVEFGPAIDPETGVDYTEFAHFGSYNLGQGTIDKNPEAGPLFLTRPVERNYRAVIDLVSNAVYKGTMSVA